MKNLSEKVLTLIIATVILSTPYGINFFRPSSVSASTECDTGYVLQWSDGTSVQDSDFLMTPAKTSVQPGDPDFSTSTTPDQVDPLLVPTTMGFVVASTSPEYSSANAPTFAKNQLQWVCNGSLATGGGLLTPAEQQNPPGTESCVAAAQIAQKYAWYTTVGDTSQIARNIGTMLLPQLQNKLANALGNMNINLTTLIGSSTLQSLFGTSNISVNQLSTYFNSTNVQNLIQKAFTDPNNPLVKGTQQALTDAQNYVKQELTKIGIQVAGQLTEQAKNILQVGQSVPVTDQGVQSAINQTTEAVKSVQAQQQKDQVIADTRAKCDLLLKQTTETIKRSLLYQFTTETVDWIQGGGIQISSDGKITVNPPQYFQRPWKDLADAGLTAVDRLISNIAPQLCQPFRLSVTLQIPSVARQTNPYYQQTTCTLNQVVGNISGFYNSFRQGGWVGYQEILMPQNNYYGAVGQAQSLAAQAASVATQEQQNEINQNGYKNQYQCTQWDEYRYAKDVNGNAITNINNCSSDVVGTSNPVVWVGSENACYERFNTVGSQGDTSVPSDAPSNIPDPNQIDVDVVGGRVFPSKSDHSFFYNCADTQIVQPSNVSAGLAQQTTQSDINSIISAQDLTDIGSIIQNAIINKLTKVGVGGLRGLLQQLPAFNGNLLQIKAP